MRKSDVLHSISYFTALAHWRPKSSARHRVFIEACKTSGITVIQGKFKEKRLQCSHCHKENLRHEEKATDVNIALHAYQLAKDVKQIFLVTGDTDLIPAVKAIKADYPSVQVGVVFPYKRFTRELKCEVDISHKVKHNILNQFILPTSLAKPDGTRISCPASWL